MNILVLLFLFWMAVPGREHNNFTFSEFWMAVPGREQISFTSASISLLFLFSFHNKNVLFCFEILQNESISSQEPDGLLFQFNEKQNNLTFFFRFIFNSK